MLDCSKNVRVDYSTIRCNTHQLIAKALIATVLCWAVVCDGIISCGGVLRVILLAYLEEHINISVVAVEILDIREYWVGCCGETE